VDAAEVNLVSAELQADRIKVLNTQVSQLVGNCASTSVELLKNPLQEEMLAKARKDRKLSRQHADTIAEEVCASADAHISISYHLVQAKATVAAVQAKEAALVSNVSRPLIPSHSLIYADGNAS